ncbi:MAG: sensor histidine kinase [Flavipsychrobacter sp.]|nr:sensor histidine kinase [Flavipsychrobacter sp.]
MSNSYAVLIFVIGTLIMMLFAFTLVIFLIIHKKKRYEHLLEKQQMANDYQTQLLQSQLEVQEQSFKYFSEEIHDNIGQLLSIVKMQLYNIRNNSKEQETITKATESNELLGKAITDLRNISHTLNSAFVSNAGLADAIEKDLEYIRSAKDVSCTLHRSGEERDLGNERELLIFRIIQEAIGNAIKHASPTAIDIYLEYRQGGALNVMIQDNGSGFDMSEKMNGGIGLNNMHVRAGLLKGIIEVSSIKDRGTIIALEITAEVA